MRRWYVLAVFAIFTAGAMGISALAGGVYWTRVDVVFLAPPTVTDPNALRATSKSLIDFAAIVERKYTGNTQVPRFSTEEATLYGSGVRVGQKVTLLNSGGQWNDSFTRPMLRVEVVDGSEALVKAAVTDIVAQLDEIARAEQASAQVPPAAFITTLMSPETAVVSTADGSRLRAAAAIALLGAFLGGTVTVLIDRSLNKREEQRSERAGPGSDTGARPGTLVTLPRDSS